MDNVDPRYLPQNLKWTVLELNQLNNTVFKTFTNSSELIEVYPFFISQCCLAH